MFDLIEIIGTVIIILYAIVFHEVAHGVVAYYLGDDTAKRAGRLTLNPISHIDLFGTILLPLIVRFGWAKPVPYNPYNLKGKYDELKVALAGPATNFLIAGLLAFVLRVANMGILPLSELVMTLIIIGIVNNIRLAVFNLIPIPPLDGSKLLYLLIPKESFQVREFLDRYGLFILLFFIFFGLQLLNPLVAKIVALLI